MRGRNTITHNVYGVCSRLILWSIPESTTCVRSHMRVLNSQFNCGVATQRNPPLLIKGKWPHLRRPGNMICATNGAQPPCRAQGLEPALQRSDACASLLASCCQAPSLPNEEITKHTNSNQGMSISSWVGAEGGWPPWQALRSGRLGTYSLDASALQCFRCALTNRGGGRTESYVCECV